MQRPSKGTRPSARQPEAPSAPPGRAGQPTGRPSSSSAPGGSSSGKGPLQPLAAPPAPAPPGARSQGGVKRPGVPAGSEAGNDAKKLASASMLRVYTKSEKGVIGIQTLVGEYVEKGMNHGRRCYQKVQKILGHEEVQVYLYYWDTRDGADFTGWWFGDQVGGSQVWSRASTHGSTPPSSGWRIPWDAPVTKDLLFVEPMESPARGQGATGASGKGKPDVAPTKPEKPAGTAPSASKDGSSGGSRVQAITRKVESLEADSEKVLASVRDVLPEEGTTSFDAESVENAERQLRQQQAKVQQAQKALATDINNARTANAPQNAVNALSQLSPRLRTLLTTIQTEITKAKQLVGKAQQHAEDQRRQAEAEEKAQAVEQRDARDFQDSLPQLIELVTHGEDAVETVMIMAAPLSVDEDLGDAARETLEDVETSAHKASANLVEAKKAVTQQLGVAKRYASSTRKAAMQELQALHDRLNEASKKLNPLKRFRQELEQKAAARNIIKELLAKLGDAELEVEKAHMQTAVGLDQQMNEDDLKSVDALMGPAQTLISESSQLFERRASGVVDEALKKELIEIEDRIKQTKEKLKGVRTVVRKQREGLSVQLMLSQATEKLEKAEAELVMVEEAEVPFLQGLEVLPRTEALQAVQVSEAAAAKAENAADLARTFIKSKFTESKQRYSKDMSKLILDELGELQSRTEDVVKKVQDLKKENAQRKTRALLEELVEKVSEAEVQVQALSEVTKLFSSESLDEVSTDNLKSASEQAAVAARDANNAYQEARKVLNTKQKEAKDPPLVSELSKLQARLRKTYLEMQNLKKEISNGERLLKSKHILLEEEPKIKEAELEVSKVETLATPLGDEHPTDEVIKQIDMAVNNAQGLLATAAKSIEGHMADAMPILKVALSKLIGRAKKAQDKIEAVKAVTKEQRERVTGDSYVKEAQQKTAEVDGALVKVSTAELPFLKGIEVLPLGEATATLKDSEVAAKAVQKAISDARACIATKTLEVRRFTKAVSDSVIEEFQKLTECINAASTRVSQFRRDTEDRRRTALMQEAAEKLASVEADVEKTREAAKPLATDDLDSLSADMATEICEKLASLEKAAQARMNEAKTFLSDMQKDVKGHAAHEEQLKKLQSRLSGIQKELAKSKQAAAEREQKFVAKKLLAEASDMVKEVEDEVTKATDFSAPLLVDGGTIFLVQQNVQMLVDAFRDQMRKDDSTKETWFQQICGSSESGGSRPSDFKAFLEKVPSVLGREDLTFSDDQKDAIFQYVDCDKNGEISVSEFEAIFRQRFACIQSISVTDAFDIQTSKTVTKLELDQLVDALSEPRVNEALGMTRLECRLVESGQVGWVTMKGNRGTTYLEPFSPYASFVKALDRLVDSTVKSSSRASTFIKQKSSELASCSQGPLSEVRAELLKLRPKVGSAQKKMDDLKKRAVDAKKEFSKRDEAEKRAQQDVRDSKTAAVILKAVAEKVGALEAELARLEESLKPLAIVEDSELEALNGPTMPISLVEAGERQVGILVEAASAAKECLQMHQGSITRGASRGPLIEAKQALSKASSKVEAVEKKGASILTAAKASCKKFATAGLAKAATAFREEVQRREITIEALFSEIAGSGIERISEGVFCERLSGLPGMNISLEQATLICRHIEAGGVSCRSFLSTLQQYYVCVKQIAVTSDFEISKSKAERMLEVDEVIEVLEGPHSDKGLGLTRVRGKALSDLLTGWISVKGNQGTPFLKETIKPFFACTADVPLEQGFRTSTASGSGTIRVLKADEVIEVLEGPRKDKPGDALRARAKASSDGAVGWFTLRDHEGVSNAEQNIKYYTCTSAIAVTDVRDIKACKVIRKLEVNEVVRVLEGPTLEQDAGVSRVHAESTKDHTRGWVTIKGNAGTVYAEESSKFYTLVNEIPLHKQFSSEKSAVVRMLAKDETVEVTEGPKEEKFETVVRVRGRALSDGAVGWLTTRKETVRAWSPYYKCTTCTVVHDTLAVKGAQVVRRLEVGEVVEVLEGPTQESDVGVLRVRARVERDGATGWITVKGNQGTAFLTCKAR